MIKYMDGVQQVELTGSPNVALTGSKSSLVTIRNQSVAAGGFFTLNTMDCLQIGYKRVTTSLRQDSSAPMEHYVSHMSSDNIITANDEGRGQITALTKFLEYTIKSSRTQVVFRNGDIASHIFNADVIWWAN
jgi:hypothetical protein